MTNDPKDITFEYYQTKAQEFYDGTVNVDMSSLYKPFLDLMPEAGSILDAGCGSGRDSKFFMNQGFNVVAFDYSPEVVRLATELIGQDVLRLSFDELTFKDQFDGVWACSSLLHVSRDEMASALSKLTMALKEGGILYTSYKYGDGEYVNKERLFIDYDEEGFDKLLGQLPELSVVEYWQTSDLRQGRGDEKWLNVLLRKCK